MLAAPHQVSSHWACSRASHVRYRDHVREASCAVDGDRPSGNFLDIGAYYVQWHVSGGLPTARHAARTSRKPSWSADSSVCRPHEVGTECTLKLTAFARTTPMADDRHTSMAFVAPHVASKYDLLPHPPAFQPPFHSSQPALPPACTPSRIPPSGRQYFC